MVFTFDLFMKPAFLLVFVNTPIPLKNVGFQGEASMGGYPNLKCAKMAHLDLEIPSPKPT